MIVVVPSSSSDAVLEVMRDNLLGRDAAVIGAVSEGRGVRLRTVIGGERPVVMLEGVQLPRIC